jgi:hypothetical protein
LNNGSRQSAESCAICEKALKRSVEVAFHLTPDAPICTDCRKELFDYISKKKRDKWTELLKNHASEFLKLKDIAANWEAEKQRLNSEIDNSRISVSKLEERVAFLSARIARMRCDEFGIEKFGISTLYHVTPIDNIPSIFRYGLLSRNKIREKKLVHTSCSNIEILCNRASIPVGDHFANDYVPLFFSEKTSTIAAMEYNENHRGKALVYVCIKGEILGDEGVYFSDGNVAAIETRKYHNLEDLEKLSWATIRAPYDKDDNEAERVKSAEVLVPNRIHPYWFQKLVVPDQEAKSELENLVPRFISIEIKPEFYFTSRGYRRY